MIVVEDGTKVAGANSYVTEAELVAYATARGVTLTGDTEELLIKAMDYVESLEYVGVKLLYTQPLQWPRADVVLDGWYQDIDTIPSELKNGLMQVAISIDNGEDPLQDIPRRQSSVSVGSISVTYEPGSSATTAVPKITSQLRKLLKSSGSSFVVLRG